MIGAGTVISPIIKVVTTVAILAAVYFFIVRPVLDTTGDVVDRASQDIQRSQDESAARAGAAELQAARSRAISFGQSVLAGSQPWPEAAREILGCAKDAGQDLQAMRRCERLGETVTSGVLSDRNFADSYADNLASQGKTGDAQRVKQCIQKAGFEPRPMELCRRLADDLLFG